MGYQEGGARAAGREVAEVRKTDYLQEKANGEEGEKEEEEKQEDSWRWKEGREARCEGKGERKQTTVTREEQLK